MTTANIYANRFDEALSHLVAFPEIALKKLHDNKIEYLACVTDKAFNAGLTTKETASILRTINTQFTKIDLKDDIDWIIERVDANYANQEASK